MTPGGKGCLGALAAAAAVVGIAGALVGPRLLRTARQVYAPVAEMKRAERAVRAMADQHPWKEPAAPEVTEDQLRRFLAVRRKLDALYGEVEPRLRALPRRRGSIRDVPAVLNGVGSVVSRQLQALIDEGMSPEEYRYLERVIYRQWREGLRGAGSGPSATSAAASAVDEAAAGEKDARTARRLREVATGLRHRTPSPPPGIPPACTRCSSRTPTRSSGIPSTPTTSSRCLGPAEARSGAVEVLHLLGDLALLGRQRQHPVEAPARQPPHEAQREDQEHPAHRGHPRPPF